MPDEECTTHLHKNMTSFSVVLFLLLLGACAAKHPDLPAVQAVPNDLQAFQLPALYNPPPPAPEPDLPPLPKAPGKHELRHAYEDGKLDLVPVGVGYPTVVRLQPGERLQTLMGGDVAPVPEGEQQSAPPDPAQREACVYGARWHVCRGTSTSYGQPVEHLAFAATHAGQVQGIAVLTDVRLYNLELKSLRKSDKRLVTWTYPDLPWRPTAPKPPGIFPDMTIPFQVHVGYDLRVPDPVPQWTPTGIFSDTKIYLQFAPTMLFQKIPLIRGMSYTGQPYLVNARQVGNWVIVDTLAERLELRDGAEKEAPVVVITRAALHAVQCPGSLECPQFPPY